MDLTCVVEIRHKDVNVPQGRHIWTSPSGLFPELTNQAFNHQFHAALGIVYS